MIQMILFEWLPFKKKWSFYVMLAAFFLLGMLTAKAANFPFADVYKNSPYIISYIVALFSQISIFSVSLLAAPVLLREQDAGFEQVLYATPVKKNSLLLSRFLLISMIASLLFLFLVIGLMIGHQLPWIHQDELGPFSAWHYLQPFLLFGLPNTIICAAIICMLGWLSKNKLMIYLSGLLIYVLYIIVSIFSNSPLMATASPVSDEAMAVAARLDPFGLAALFEQTRYWSPLERNTQLPHFSGSVLINRATWMLASLVFTIAGIRSFRLSTGTQKTRGTKQVIPASPETDRNFEAAKTNPGNRRYHLQTIYSFLKIDCKSIVKGIPFLLLCLAWIFLLGMEIYGTIEAGIRLPERYVSTALMVNTILKTIPVFCLMAVLFYSNEITWRSRNVKMAVLENSNPVQGSMVFISKLVSLSVIPFVLTLLSIIAGVVFQLIYQYAPVDIGLYCTLLYLVTLPMACCLAIIMSIQMCCKNKYAGIAIALLFVLLSNTSVGQMIGLKNPLFRIGNSYAGLYSEMNGYGDYLRPFTWNLLYAAGIAFILALVAGNVWNRSEKFSFGKFISANKIYFAVPMLLLLMAASSIFYQNNILHPTESTEGSYNRKQDYEQAYRTYNSMPQPTITTVQTQIDLYPDEQSYRVSGTYWLQNKTANALDSFLLYFDKECSLQKVDIASAALVKRDERLGHYMYRFNKTLAPLDSCRIDFSFSYAWSGFKGHQSFNAIIENGSFIRISNYFPAIGYQPANEIDDKQERAERNMGEGTVLANPEDSSQPNHFIMLDMQVSTAAHQTVVGIGELVKQWQQNGRNYFKYTSGQPIPFRFALSSARYAIKKEHYQGKALEVYYHPSHAENVDSLIQSAKRTLVYCEKNFGPYPFKTIRFAEVSSFTKGFAGTAYPASIFMTEDMVFHTNIKKSKSVNVISELAAHELAHQWWGGNLLQPANKKGRSVLTEALAMYTELMLNKQVADSDAIIHLVKMYKGLYFSESALSNENVLYKAAPGEIFLNYYKGVVAMYQLQLMIGEGHVNRALQHLLLKHAYPFTPAATTDLLHELYAVSNPQQQILINEIFREVITHEVKISSSTVTQISDRQYQLDFGIAVAKFNKTTGKKVPVAMNDSVDVLIYTAGHQQLFKYPVLNNKIAGRLILQEKPVKLVVDPYIKLMDAFDEDNVKELP